MWPEAFSDFYRAVLPDVYGYLLRLCAGNRAQAEDLTQDVWWATLHEEHDSGLLKRVRGSSDIPDDGKAAVEGFIRELRSPSPRIPEP